MSKECLQRCPCRSGGQGIIVTNLEKLWKEAFLGNDAFFSSNINYSGYPYYDIIKVDNSTVQLNIAVAGFAIEDIDVTVEDGVLSIVGATKDQVDNANYVVKGISKKGFTRKWRLANDAKISSAQLSNGILSITVGFSQEKNVERIEIK